MIKKILITGANGFVGSNLTDFCINKGYKVFAIDRPQASFKNFTHYTNGKEKYILEEKTELFGELIQFPSSNENLIFIECDLKNRELLEKLIREISPDYLFHLAAQPYIIPSWDDPVDTIETNVIGTINIFEPIKKYNIKSRVLIACTAAEFGTTTNLDRPLKETDPLMAINPYGISKIAAELLARQYYINFNIEAIIVRFFNLTGFRRTNDAPSDFIRKIAQIDLGLIEPKIEVGNLNPYRDFTDIEDAINAIWLAIETGDPGEIYHICSNRKTQIRELLNIALGFSNKEIKVIENIPNKLRKTDEDTLTGDNSKIKTKLGFKISKPLERTLKEMYDYWIKYYEKNRD